MNADQTRLHSLLDSGVPLNWVLTGDSITHGLLHTQGARNYVDHLHELIRGDMGRVHDVLINTAISGWRCEQLLEDFDRRVATWHPHVVTLMIGTNDCSDAGLFPAITAAEFADSVTRFVARVRELDAIPVLLTQPAIDVPHAPERARIGDFAQAIRDVAAAENVILVDPFARFSQLGGDRVALELLDDPFHPNAAGHAVLAREVADVLGLRAPEASDRVRPDLQARIAHALTGAGVTPG